MEIISRANAPHYAWGRVCDGWRLVDREELAVTEERMPPGSAEIAHYHRRARQFFFVLEGELTIQTPGASFCLRALEGVEIPPGTPHLVQNSSGSDVSFLVIASPRTIKDRVELGAGVPQQMETVITYLEMTSPQELRAKECLDARFSIQRLSVPQWKFNRFLYALIGERWNWTEKNVWSDEQWRAYAESPNLQTFVAYDDGAIAGYFEIERQGAEQVEITYLGLAEEFFGRGFGGALLTRAVNEAWKWGAARVWLHTCTLDHPTALKNYLARGFKIFKTERKTETLRLD